MSTTMGILVSAGDVRGDVADLHLGADHLGRDEQEATSRPDARAAHRARRGAGYHHRGGYRGLGTEGWGYGGGCWGVGLDLDRLGVG